ncbi:hypothetical protein ACP70R_008119 [Stipagrostis hirtigluma subsp. patula]
MAASLPQDILLDVFRRLEATAVLSCAAACKPWRRAIIGNASCLRPRPDRFLPELLLGFFYTYWARGRLGPCATMPGPLEAALAVAMDAGDETKGFVSRPGTVPPFAQAAAGVDMALYDETLSSRDGHLLLKGSTVQDLCLYNPMTGGLDFVPAAAFRAHTYVLVTGYDLTPSDGDEHASMVHIFAARMDAMEGGYVMSYQIFSTSGGGATSGWGPVSRSSDKLRKDAVARMSQGHEVICGGAIHWLGSSMRNGLFTCTIAIDMRTGRTWTTRLPENYHGHTMFVMATSMDGRLSVVSSCRFSRRIQVWVLIGAGRWTLRRTIDVYRPSAAINVQLIRFCPRSGCVLAKQSDKVLHIDIERCLCSPVWCIGPSIDFWPYEMDWATYISKMKFF